MPASGSLVAGTIGEVAASVRLTTTGIAEADQAAERLAVVSTDLRDVVERFRH